MTVNHIVAHVKSRLVQYRKYRNTLVPAISHLPIELFSHILLLSVPPDEWSVRRLQDLALVSTSWKSIVLGTAELWSIAKAHQNPEDDRRWKENLHLALKRSKELPLQVRYGKEGSKIRYFNARPVEEFMKIVGAHAHRWRSMDYAGCYTQTILAEMERPAPILETLNVELRDMSSEDDSGPEENPRRIALSTRLGHLRHVRVRSAPLLWTSLKNLQTLSIVFINAYHSRPKPRAADFLALLRSLPTLESLYLSDIHELADAEDIKQRCLTGKMTAADRIHLPRLQDFQIGSLDFSLTLALGFCLCAENVTSLAFRVSFLFSQFLDAMDPSLLFLRP